MRPCEAVELVVSERQRARDLARPIGAEVEDDERVTVTDRSHRRTAGVDDDDRLDELVGDATVVRRLNCRER